MDKIRWGIIGPGSIAGDFARDMQFSKNSVLSAVASRSEARAAAFAREFKAEKHYGNYGSLFNDPGIDAVYVATPHTFHYAHAVDALSAGKPVLCEKPLTPGLQETIALAGHAQACGVYLMEGMWTYFLPVIQKAQQWVIEDRIGSIRHVKAEFGYTFPYDPARRHYDPELAGGCLLDLGCYTIALAWLFLEQDPRDMRVICRKAPNGVDLDVIMQFAYNEASASLHASFLVKLHNWAFIIGEKRNIAIPDFWRAKECFLYEGEKVTDHFKDDRQGFGLNFEMDQVSRNILESKKQSQVMPLDYSLKIAGQIDQVMRRF